MGLSLGSLRGLGHGCVELVQFGAMIDIKNNFPLTFTEFFVSIFGFTKGNSTSTDKVATLYTTYSCFKLVDFFLLSTLVIGFEKPVFAANVSNINDGPHHHVGSTASRCWPYGGEDHSCYSYL